MRRPDFTLRPVVVAFVAALVFFVAYSVDLRAFSLDPRRYPTSTLTYGIDASYANRGSAWSTRAHGAANDWTVATNIDIVHDPSSPNRIKSGTLDPSRWAEMRPFYNGSDMYLVRYDIVVNDLQSKCFWDGTVNPWPPNCVDLGTVLRHEFGHAVGLGHSHVDERLMHPTIETNRIYPVDTDEQNAVNYLYLGTRADFPRKEAENLFNAIDGDSATQHVGYSGNGWQNPFACPNARTRPAAIPVS